MTPLKRAGLIDVWCDQQLVPGEVWEKKVFRRLNEAHIVLMLVSADFLHSSFCYEKEVQLALARHEEGAVSVIPVIVRASEWQVTPLGRLQAVPKDARAVMSWLSRDEAWADVTRSLRHILESRKAEEGKAEERKVEERKVEERKAEERKAEERKAEERKAEERKAEERKAERPRAARGQRTPPSVRVLPMSKEEFETLAEVRLFLSKELGSPDRGGKYHYRKVAMRAVKDTLVLFQYGGAIVGHANLASDGNVVSRELVDEGYEGYYLFEPATITAYTRPLQNSELNQIWPRIALTNAKHILDPQQWPRYLTLLAESGLLPSK